MFERHWRGIGPNFELSWAAADWQLQLDGPRPGLRHSGSDQTFLLTLEALAVQGRSAPWRSERPRLAKVDSLFDRIEATYALPAWGGLSIRASWSLGPEPEVIDLEIQVLADSVDFLKGVEVQVISQLGNPERPMGENLAVDLSAEPRDRESAGLSYDGREPAEVLHRLCTLPVPSPAESSFDPIVTETPWLGEGSRYIEFVHPDDVARRLGATRQAGSGLADVIKVGTRYCLFGHDLEKGVLLRARMRGVWSPALITHDEIQARFQEFRDGPLPLGP